MRKIRNLVIGGIENKLFNLILISVLLITAAFLAAIQYQSRMLSQLTAETSARQIGSITETTTEVIKQAAEQSMSQTTELSAMLSDEVFHGLENRVQMLGDYAYKIFSDPDHTMEAPYAPPDASKDGEVTAQMILADSVEEQEIADRLHLAANMSDMMVSLFDASEATNSCFIALPEGAFLVTDDRSAAKYAEDGTPISYDPRTRIWYQMAEEQQGLIFTDVELDAFTGDVGIVCAMPVYVDGELTAVVGSDLFLTSMQEAVQATGENNAFVCVINQNGHVVFSPKTEGSLRVLDSSEAADLRLSENESLAALVADAMQGKTDMRQVDLEDGSYYMIGAPMETLGWALLEGVDREITAQPSVRLQDSFSQIQQEAVQDYYAQRNKVQTNVIILLLILLALLCAGALVLGKRIVKPLNTITKRISELNEGNLEFKMEDAYRTGDEIEVLAESFASLSHKTVQYVDKVREVTAEKERISTELHMANQIQESMLPSIFPAFPDRPEFDIYASMEPAKYVGGDFYDFFLIDEDHLCMVIADVSGKGIPAALFMMISKIILQSCAMLGRSVEEILEKTNEALCSNNKMEMFVTVWLGILEISTGKVTAANAGHEYPVIKRKDGRFELLKDKHGFVIGGYDGMKYKKYDLLLEPGDKLFLYTDGLPEAENNDNDMFGTERMLQVLNEAPEAAAPQQVLAHVRSAVGQFVQDAEQFDDLTMLCVEYRGKGETVNTAGNG